MGFEWFLKEKPQSGRPRRNKHPLTVASFRTWRGWAAPARMVPDMGHIYHTMMMEKKQSAAATVSAK